MSERRDREKGREEIELKHITESRDEIQNSTHPLAILPMWGGGRGVNPLPAYQDPYFS